MPYLKQGKDVVWDYMKHYTSVIPGVDYNASELSVLFPNGARLRIYGADNEESLRGNYLDGVVLDEYGNMSNTVWGQIIRPQLSDYRGWAFFIGTPNGRNQFYELIYGASDSTWQGAKQEPDWFFAEYRASQTGVLPGDELASARKAMTEDQYQQEYECSFEAAIKGAVFARELSAAKEYGRIGRAAFDPRLPVDTSWDLGIDDATAIWFSQTVPGGEVRLLEYYEANGQALHHYVGVLRDRQASHGYVYGEHYLPHDIEVKELGTGHSRLEALRAMGLHSVVVVKRFGLDDGINAARMLFPRCWFDEARCARGIDALRNYRWKELTADSTGRTLPVHDWASHGADAFRTLACAPQRMDKLISQWNKSQRDVDPADKFRRSQQSGRRGGW